MKVGISLKINVTEIDKARLFAGAKGKYLDATVFVDINEFDQYGNSGMITQDVSKDEKAQGVKGNILGNCKVFWSDGGTQQAKPQQQQGVTPISSQAVQKIGPQNFQQGQQQYQQSQQAPQTTKDVNLDFNEDIPF